MYAASHTFLVELVRRPKDAALLVKTQRWQAPLRTSVDRTAPRVWPRHCPGARARKHGGSSTMRAIGPRGAARRSWIAALTPVVVWDRQHWKPGAFAAAAAERLVGHAPGDAPGAAAVRVAAPARGGARGGRVNGDPDAFQRRRGGRTPSRLRGAAGAARTSGARRPSRRRERRTISRRSFLPRAGRAPVSASLAPHMRSRTGP